MDWLAGWLAGCLVGWLAGWLLGWLSGLAGQPAGCWQEEEDDWEESKHDRAWSGSMDITELNMRCNWELAGRDDLLSWAEIFENTRRALLFTHCTRNHCSAVLRGHWALEMTAKVCVEATLRSKSLLQYTFFFFDSIWKHRTAAAVSHGALEVTALARSAAMRRSKSLLGLASKSRNARNRCSSKLLCTRQHSGTFAPALFFRTARREALRRRARQPQSARIYVWGARFGWLHWHSKQPYANVIHFVFVPRRIMPHPEWVPLESTPAK